MSLQNNNSSNDNQQAKNHIQKSDLLFLYELACKKQQYFLAEHQKRIAFYMGLLTALVSGIFVGMLNAGKWYYFLPLSFASFGVVKACSLGKEGSRRLYQRFLEAITDQAKLEEDLGLTKQRYRKVAPERDIWVFIESFITKRHLDSRKEGGYKTSKEWVDAHLEKKENYHGVAMRLFSYGSLFGWFLLVFTILVSIKNSGIVNLLYTLSKEF
jgi:hypothetical protein